MVIEISGVGGRGGGGGGGGGWRTILNTDLSPPQ